jgi:hypothetical protein
MEIFNLPPAAEVNRVVPKNAFDAYTNARQKRLFASQVSRITWTHKLSPDTVNLQAKDIKEIQIFRIELKVKEEIQPVLDVIDKAIPYHIVFIVAFKGRFYLSASTKHPHPTKEDTAVIDWNFRTNWFKAIENNYRIQLKKSIDSIFHDICIQLSGKIDLADRPLQYLIEYSKRVEALQKEVVKLKGNISNGKQFNQKVELNVRLKEIERELQSLSLSRPKNN